LRPDEASVRLAQRGLLAQPIFAEIAATG